MFGMGVQELLIILFIVLLLFGAKKLPGLANSLGSSVAEFKKGLKGPAEADKSDKVIDARNDSADAVPKQKSDAKT